MITDEQLSSALESLPREPAPLGFTASVLRRIDSSPARFSPAWWTSIIDRVFGPWIPRHAGTAVAAAAVLVLTVGFSWREWRQHQAAEHLQMLLAEKHALEAELASLQRLTEEAHPVVYLGGDEEVDLVLDLARFQRQGGFGSKPPAAEPAPSDRRLAELRTDPSVRPIRVVY